MFLGSLPISTMLGHRKKDQFHWRKVKLYSSPYRHMLLGCLGERRPWTPASKLLRCPRGSPQNHFQGVMLIGPQRKRTMNGNSADLSPSPLLSYLCGSGSLSSTSSSIKWEEREVNLSSFSIPEICHFEIPDPKGTLQKWWNSIRIIKESLQKQKLTSNSDLKKMVVFFFLMLAI